MLDVNFDFEHINFTNRSATHRSRKKQTNSVYQDETSRYIPSLLDLHCLQTDLFYSAELKGLKLVNEHCLMFSNILLEVY